MFRCSHHLKVRFLGTVIILGFLLCFQSFDLNNESPLNLLEEHWLGRERRELCVWSSWSWSCINSVYLQLDIRSEFFSFLFLQFIRQAEEDFWKPAKILTKGCFGPLLFSVGVWQSLRLCCILWILCHDRVHCPSLGSRWGILLSVPQLLLVLPAV